MIIPDRYNYAEIYLTFRCNLSCPYCINNVSKIERKRNELTGKEWIPFLNSLEYPCPLTFGGGEPTLHPDFYEIIRGLRPGIRVDLLSNLTFDVDVFLDEVSHRHFNMQGNNAYKSIRVSYHPKSMSPEELIRKARKIQDYGYSIGIFGTNYPENIEANVLMSELARQNMLYFFIKDFLGIYDTRLFGYYLYPKAVDGIPKKCRCRNKEVLISPDGKIYRCHRDLYADENEIGNITDTVLPFNDDFRDCDKYGMCNYCDIKLKTNRFLNMGNCSVEIL